MTSRAQLQRAPTPCASVSPIRSASCATAWRQPHLRQSHCPLQGQRPLHREGVGRVRPRQSGAGALIGAGLTMLLTRTTGSDVMGMATSTLKSAAASGAGAARGTTQSPGYQPLREAWRAPRASRAPRDAVKGATDHAAHVVSDTASAVTDRVAGSTASARQTAAEGVEAARNPGRCQGQASVRARLRQGSADRAATGG
jgi:hypothetical protein